MTNDFDNMFQGSSQDQMPNFNGYAPADDGSSVKGNWISSSGGWFHDDDPDTGGFGDGDGARGNNPLSSQTASPVADQFSSILLSGGQPDRVTAWQAATPGKAASDVPTLPDWTKPEGDSNKKVRLAGGTTIDNPGNGGSIGRASGNSFSPALGSDSSQVTAVPGSSLVSGGASTRTLGADARLTMEKSPYSPFSPEVVGVMEDVNRNLTLDPRNSIGRAAALNYAGEENQNVHDKGWFASLFHQWHDHAANNGELYGANIPENWATPKAGLIKNGLAQSNPLLYDTGPLNIKILSAEQASHPQTADDLDNVAKSITTVPGSAKVLSVLVNRAQNTLNPLISSLPPEAQVQILTNYLRQGPDFIQNIKTRRGMTDVQFQQWRANPSTFRMPDGSVPAPLDPYKIDPVRHDQVGQVAGKMAGH